MDLLIRTTWSKPRALAGQIQKLLFFIFYFGQSFLHQYRYHLIFHMAPFKLPKRFRYLFLINVIAEKAASHWYVHPNILNSLAAKSLKLGYLSLSKSFQNSNVLQFLHQTKSFVHFFYGNTLHDKSHNWKCRYGKLRKQIIKQGYRNLIGHISSSHPDHLELYHEAQQLSATSTRFNHVLTGQTTLTYLVDAKSTNIFKWLEWIIIKEHE